jgi:hypothetical protein
VAQRVARQCLERNLTFFPADEYGAALLHLALWEANAAFPNGTMDFSAAQAQFLDTYVRACARGPCTNAERGERE